MLRIRDARTRDMFNVPAGALYALAKKKERQKEKETELARGGSRECKLIAPAETIYSILRLISRRRGECGKLEINVKCFRNGERTGEMRNTSRRC